MSDTTTAVSAPSVPAPTAPVGAPATANPARDLVAERAAEMRSDSAAAEKKKSRFEARKITSLSAPAPSAPEYETLIFKAAANNPLAVLNNPANSTFVPNLAPLFFILNYMDFLMASTKRWTDNCMGWAPPFSQMYISVLIYIQIMRAMECAGQISPGSELANVLLAFNNLFPLDELWIPGPLVAAFRNLSAFWPSATDRFGNVCPTLPATPGWTAANNFCLANNWYNLLPNVSLFISRLRTICGTATTANMTQAIFDTHIDGPMFAHNMFGAAMTNAGTWANNMVSPGAGFIYAGSLELWKATAARLAALNVPADLAAATVPRNRWTAVMRFDQFDNEHVWFGPVAAMMAKYCQFFKGSVSLGNCPPNASAAAAVKCRLTANSSIWTVPTWNATAGTGASTEHGNANAAAHYTCRTNARVELNARVAIEDLPDAHAYAGVTFAFNSYDAVGLQNASRVGNFWTLGPDVSGRDSIEVLPGILSTITREYHSDVRIDSSKQ